MCNVELKLGLAGFPWGNTRNEGMSGLGLRLALHREGGASWTTGGEGMVLSAGLRICPRHTTLYIWN